MHLFWYTLSMPNSPTILNVRFFRTEAGNEPVREWLTDLPREARRLIGTDIKTVQLGWPIGMPVVRKLENGLWEVRTSLADTIARVIFTVVGTDMILLHGFIKKSQKTPVVDLNTAKQRKARL
jgi:phage-related protein